MLIDGVHGEPNDLDVAPVKLRLEPGHVAELGRAYRREILRMREQDGPGIADPLVETHASFGRFRFEIRGCITDLQSHRRSPFIMSRVGLGYGRLLAGDIVSIPVSVN